MLTTADDRMTNRIGNSLHTLPLSSFHSNLHLRQASILFLVLGDMSAAIIGVSFGGETVSLKLGREGKKSLEGWPAK